MAFSSTIQGIAYGGPGTVTLTGTWSGSAGDAAGTMAVSGPVISALFEKFDNDQTTQILSRCSTSTTSGITTITVNNQDNVTTGYFTIRKGGM